MICMGQKSGSGINDGGWRHAHAQMRRAPNRITNNVRNFVTKIKYVTMVRIIKSAAPKVLKKGPRPPRNHYVTGYSRRRLFSSVYMYVHTYEYTYVLSCLYNTIFVWFFFSPVAVSNVLICFRHSIIRRRNCLPRIGRQRVVCEIGEKKRAK